MPIKLIIFDLDGTLIDSSADITNALNAAAKPFGMEPISINEAQEIIGGGLNKLIERLLEKKKIPVDRDRLLKAFLHEYEPHLTDCTRPYPRVPQTLALLDGITKTILSNKITRFTVEIVKRFGWAEFFASIEGGDVVAEKKPSPIPIVALLDRFGVERDEAMIVGDSAYDVQAGHRAGIHTVAAMYGYGMHGFDEEADFRIHAFAELPAIVNSVNNTTKKMKGS